jgi:hypothetical protein
LTDRFTIERKQLLFWRVGRILLFLNLAPRAGQKGTGQKNLRRRIGRLRPF